MRNILAILFVLCSASAFAQVSTKFGANRSTDTSYTPAFLKLPVYATSDTDKVLGIDANGIVALRTKGGGGGSTDSTIFVTVTRLGDSLGQYVALRDSESVYYTVWHLDSTFTTIFGVLATVQSEVQALYDTLPHYFAKADSNQYGEAVTLTYFEQNIPDVAGFAPLDTLPYYFGKVDSNTEGEAVTYTYYHANLPSVAGLATQAALDDSMETARDSLYAIRAAIPSVAGLVADTRTITINGTTQDLSADRTYNVGTVTSVAAADNWGISWSGSPVTASGTLTPTLDSAEIATRGRVQKAVDSITANFYPSSNPSGYTSNTGTVTSVGVVSGTGISISGTSPVTGAGTVTVTNTAPDQTVTITASTNVTVTGTYPNFTISASGGGGGGSLKAGAGITLSAGTGDTVIVSLAPRYTDTLTETTTIDIDFSNDQFKFFEITQADTLTFDTSAMLEGREYILKVVQDGTGYHALYFSQYAIIKFVGGSTTDGYPLYWSKAANKETEFYVKKTAGVLKVSPIMY